MSLTGHLVELRNRLYISALSLVPGTILGFIFAGNIIHFIVAPLPKGHLVAFGLTEPFMIDMQVALTVAAEQLPLDVERLLREGRAHPAPVPQQPTRSGCGSRRRSPTCARAPA